jgi:hypothetical protein
LETLELRLLGAKRTLVEASFKVEEVVKVLEPSHSLQGEVQGGLHCGRGYDDLFSLPAKINNKYFSGRVGRGGGRRAPPFGRKELWQSYKMAAEDKTGGLVIRSARGREIWPALQNGVGNTFSFLCLSPALISGGLSYIISYQTPLA